MQDIVLGMAVASAGLALLLVLIPVGVPAQMSPNPLLAPDFWPRIVAWFLLALGALMAIRSAVALRRRGRVGGPDARGAETGATPLLGVAAVVLAFVAHALIGPIGIAPACAGLITVLVLLAGESRPLPLLTVALGVPLALQLFFTRVASVPLPEVLFPGWF